MPARPVPFTEIKRTVEIWHEVLDEGYPPEGTNGTLGAPTVAARRVGLSYKDGTATLRTRLNVATALGIPVRSSHAIDQEWADAQVRRYREADEDFRNAENSFGRGNKLAPKIVKPPDSVSPSRGVRAGRGRTAADVPSDASDSPVRAKEPAYTPVPSVRDLADQIVPALRRGPLSLEQIAVRLSTEPLIAEAALEIAHARGALLHERGGVWHLDSAPAMGSQKDTSPHRLIADRNGVIRFATVGDTHLGSKYSREDCLSDFYDEVARREIPVVLHAGNWIDGEANFNKHDLMVHGMDNQMRYLAENYPKRSGVQTWAITGEDHEGWYSRREGIDVGRYAQNVMRHAGRDDWIDVGFMETFIPLVHPASGKFSQLCLMHPGGGSAYAISYQPQKIVESFDGGDKPAVLVLGHYHKASYNLIRNVHTIQTGCFQDQSLFMRKLKIAAHLAGCFLEVHLDPETAAAIECTTSFRNYFVRGYYHGRWSQHGPVEHAVRTP